VLAVQLYRCANGSVLINLNKLQTEEAGQDATVCVPCSLCAVGNTGACWSSPIIASPQERDEIQPEAKGLPSSVCCRFGTKKESGRNFVLTSIVQFNILQSGKCSFHRKLNFFFFFAWTQKRGRIKRKFISFYS